MDDILIKILLGLVAVGFFSDLLKGLFQKRKVKASANLDDATATQIIVTSTTTLLGPLTTRLESAEAKVAHLEKELTKAQRQVDEIVGRLTRCNQENTVLVREKTRLEIENNKLKLRLQGGKS